MSSLSCTAGGLISGRDDLGDQASGDGEVNAADEFAGHIDEEADPDERATVEDNLNGGDLSVSVPLAGSGGCANVFYPMVLDQQWVYQVTSAEETSNFGMTVSTVSENLATVDFLAYETGVTTSVEVVCEDGAIINFPNMMLGFLFGEVDGQVELEHLDGVFSPSYDDLVGSDWDYDWTTDYLASGVLTASSDGEMLSAALTDSPVHMEWETRGERETVEVDAGTFEDALVVERKTEFDADLTLVIDGETLSVEGTVILETRMWFVPFQGLVKQEVTRTQLKLGAAAFPVESDTLVELVEFYPAE